MERLPNQQTIDEERERFLEKAEALAEEYDMSPNHVMEIFAGSEGKQVEKHLDNKELLEKLFTEDTFRDDARWEMVETKLQLEQSEENAMIDALTGLYNRGALDHELERRAEIFKRDAYSEKAKPFSYILIDLDNFKQLNDTFGHLVGDEVLKFVGEKIQSHIRPVDFAGRYGGEEFCVLVDGDIKAAGLLAERIRKDMAELKGEELRTLGVDPSERESITASFGISEFAYTGDIEHDLKTLTDRADKALYEAKNTGKNQVLVATPNRAE